MSGSYTPTQAINRVEDLETGAANKTRIVHSKTVVFDHKYANYLLGLIPAPGDRVIDSKHVDRIARDMARGKFRWETAFVSSCTYNREEYRTNGQHTASARLLLPDSQKYRLTHIKYSANSLDALRELYKSIDRGKIRSAANQVDAALLGTPGFESFGRMLLRSLVSGVRMWQFGGDKVMESDTDLHIDFIQGRYHSVACHVGNFLNSYTAAESKHVRRQPAVAAMFATWDRAVRASEDFWHAVVTGEILERGDPAMTLRNYLLESSNRGITSKKVVTPDHMFRACIYAWDAYRQGRQVLQLRPKVTGPKPNPV